MNALAMLELMSVPKGIESADAMLKAASVRLVTAQAVCAGKYIAIVTGDVAAVKESLEAGKECAGSALVDSISISNIHEDVISAINACSEIGEVGAIGVSETYSLSSAVLIADAMVKAADIKLIEVRLGRGLGGKSFVLMTGEVAAVKSAIEAGESIEEVQGMVAKGVIIPSPHPELIKAIV